MPYRVYLWKSMTSQEAEVMQETQALNADRAIQRVMAAVQWPYAFYAWVVPVDDEEPCVERYRVRCSAARAAGH